MCKITTIFKIWAEFYGGCFVGFPVRSTETHQIEEKKDKLINNLGYKEH